MRAYQPEHSTDGQTHAAYEFEATIKLAQMKQGNVAAFLNAQNYTFLCSGGSA